MSKGILSGILLLFIAGYAYAGPPLLTDDTGTPGNGKWEINIGFTSELNKEENRFLLPLLDFNYGLGERIQLKYEAPWIISDRKDNSTIAGPGNSVFGIKYRFLDEEKDRISMSIYPQLEFNNPTSSADRGLVNKGSTWLLPVQVEKKVGWVNLNAEIGYLIRASEKRGVYGFVAGHKFDRLEALVEIHGEGLRNFKKHHVVYNFGVRYDLSKRYSINASMGRSFTPGTNEDPDLISYLGLQMRF